MYTFLYEIEDFSPRVAFRLTSLKRRKRKTPVLTEVDGKETTKKETLETAS